MPSRKTMGAIDPVVARQHVKTKSASIEGVARCGYQGVKMLTRQQAAPSIRCSAINLHESSAEDDDEDDDEFFYYKKSDYGLSKFPIASSCNRLNANNNNAPNTVQHPDKEANTVCETSNNSIEVAAVTPARVALAAPQPSAAARARNFLSATIGNFKPGLRPAASASCLVSSPSSTNLSIDSGEPSSAVLDSAIVTTSVDDSKILSKTANTSNKSSSVLASLPTRASLTHEWRKLRTPGKCRECSMLVYFNGRECSCCGFIAHKKCLVTLVIKCNRDQIYFGSIGRRRLPQPNQQQQQQHNFSSRNALNKTKPIFGQPLANSDKEQVLDFVRRFLYEIDTRGLTARGIYRVSSIKSKVDRLCHYYDQNPSHLVDLSSFHPNIIANALKIYLRQLPEPLLTHKLYQDFISIAKKYSTTASQLHSSSSSSSSSSLSSSLSNAAAAAAAATAAAGAGPAVSRAAYTGVAWRSKRRLDMHKSALSHQVSSTSLPSADNNNKMNNATVKKRPTHQQVSINSRPKASDSPSGPLIAPYDQRLIDDIRQIVDGLPAINREIVALIMRHLRRVADMCDENQMSARNLSIIFGPTLLDLEKDNKSLAIVDNIHQARVVELMIQWAYEIFPHSHDEDEAGSLIEPDYSSHVSC